MSVNFARKIFVDERMNQYVTLENWAVNDHKAVNDLWDFRTYEIGTEKSYHSVLTSTGGYGNIAFTFKIML